jgi:hypothetical protein
MYYLINTFSSVGSGHVGRVVSRHRTEEAAERAQEKLGRDVERANGRGSYLPTTILSDVEIYIETGDAYRK